MVKPNDFRISIPNERKLYFTEHCEKSTFFTGCFDQGYDLRERRQSGYGFKGMDFYRAFSPIPVSLRRS